MLAVAFSLLSALGYGLGGFLGGLNARKSSVIQILPSVLVAGAVTITLSIPFLGATLTVAAIKAGIASTIFGLTSYYAVYKAISIGPMGIAAAIVAVICAGIPYLVSIVQGEQVNALGIAGALLALVSILLVCKSSEDAKHPITKEMVVTAVVAGLLAAGFVISLASAPKETGIASFVFTRWCQVVILLVAAFFLRKKYDFSRVDYRLTFANGAIDTMASMFLIVATHYGSLGLVAIISNMSPAITLVIAHYAIHEKVERHQIVGMLGACASVAMLSLA